MQYFEPVRVRDKDRSTFALAEVGRLSNLNPYLSIVMNNGRSLRFIFTKLIIFAAFSVKAQSPSILTANEYVKPYTGVFQYGSNVGYFGNGWDERNLGAIINKAGGRSLRPSLPESFLERYGYTFNLPNFKTYVNELGMKEITCFIGGPSEAHRDTTIYPGSEKQSKIFANLYEPIWNPDSTVNQNNYYAAYVYKLLQVYGNYVKFWEVVNEPDYAYSYSIAQKWATRAPLPGELPNLQAPVYNYIRMLRITWEVVKKYNPDQYVMTGGIGYTQFLDAILRYTDNPNNGGVTEEYSRKGGAYFDVLSYHVYPAFNMAKWDNSIGGFRYTRTSDYLAKNVIDYKEEMASVLRRYGYDGNSYPQKNFLLTETNVSRRTASDHFTNDEMQRNFGVKALIQAQKNGIAQFYFFDLGEAMDAPPAGDTVVGYDEFRLMGLYENLKRDKPGSEKLTDIGKAFKTTAQLLYGYRYDADRTTLLQMPSNVDGAAFVKEGKYVYVLWAKALIDKSEYSTAQFSFPTTILDSSVYRYEWHYSLSDSFKVQSSQQLALTGSPAIFSADPLPKLPKNQIINFSPVSSKTYGDAPFTVSATSSSNLPVNFRIVSGPATVSGNSISIIGAGTVIIEAIQPGNANYEQAVGVTQSFVVAKVNQTVTLSSISSKTYGDQPFTPTTTSSSGLPVSIRIVSGPAVAVNNEISITGSGWVNVEASQVGDSTYNAAKPVTQGFTAYKANQTIDFAPLAARMVTDSPFVVNATASSGLTVTFKILYGPATISGNLVTLTGTGLVGITASQIGNNAYSGAPNVTQSFSVNRAATASSLNPSTEAGNTGRDSFTPFGQTSDLLSGAVKKGQLSLNTFPNPFTHKVNIQVTVEKTEKVSVALFNLEGRLIKMLYSGTADASVPTNIVLPAAGLSQSTYIVQLTTNNTIIGKKILLAK